MSIKKIGAAVLATMLTAFTVPLTSISLRVPALAQDPSALQAVYQQILNSYEQELAEARKTGVRWQEVDVLNGAGIAYRYFGNYQKALEVQQQALAIAREIKDRARETGLIRELAATYSKLGDYQGINFYEQQLQLAQKSGDLQTQAAILQNLGIAYMSQTNYQKAVEVYEQYLPLVRQQKDALQEDITLSILSSAYRVLGDRQKAAALLEQRLALARQTKNQATEISILFELAASYRFQSSPQKEKAIATYQQALQIARQANNPQQEMLTLRQLADVYGDLGNTQQVLELLEQTLAIAQRTKDAYSQGSALESLSRFYALTQNYTKAIDLQKQSLAVYQTLKQSPKESSHLEAQALSSLGILLFHAKQFQEAETTLSAALKVHQLVREQVLGNSNLFAESRDDLNLSLREQLADTYRTLQQVLVATNRTDAALEIAEEGRARAFVDLLAAGSSANQAHPPVKVTPPNLAQIQQIAKAQNATLVQYSVIYDDIRYASLNIGQTGAREAGLLIWVIQPTGKVTFRQVDFKTGLQRSNLLQELVKDARASLGTGNRGFAFNEDPEVVRRIAAAGSSDQTTNEQLQKLYQLLIQPIANLLPNDSQAPVIFIPQDSLFLVPFAALQDTTGKYLIERHTILTAPSIQVLELASQNRQQPSAPPSSLLIVGNPTMPSFRLQLGTAPQPLASLPGAEQEAKAIAVLLKTQVLTGRQATETNIVQQMPQARIVHLATHGLLDSFGGFQSAIALAPSDQADGLLTAREILNLKLNTELVVLSACDTGRGRISGDGVIGLSRSLMSAGASSVIVSLWKVPDTPTASLMIEFYKNLQTNPNKAQALRQAMLATLKQYPDPRDWAAFTLMGKAD